MLKLGLNESIIEVAKENLEVNKRLYAEGKVCGHDHLLLNYDFCWDDIETKVTEFPAKVECEGKLYSLERMFENGFGVFDLHYLAEDETTRLMLTGMNVERDGARATMLEAVRRGLTWGVGRIDAEALTKDGAESSVQYGDVNICEDDLDALMVGDTFYSLAHIRRYEAVPGTETKAARILPKQAMDMTYLAIKDRNGPCTDDILTIYNVRNRWALEHFESWRPAPIVRELFEQDVCQDCQEEEDEQAAKNLNQLAEQR